MSAWISNPKYVFNDNTGYQVTPNATVSSYAFLMTLKYFRYDCKDVCLVVKHWFTLSFGTGGITFLGTLLENTHITEN